MKILLISELAPTVENYNGPSALNYHLLHALKKYADVYIITTNGNKVPYAILKKSISSFKKKYEIRKRSLLMKLIVSDRTDWLFSMFSLISLPNLTRYKLSMDILKKIGDFNPDLIIVYPDVLLGVMKQLGEKYKVLVIGPDCNPLFGLRTLDDRYVYDKNLFNKTLINLYRQINLEKQITKYCDYVGLVGLKDQMLFKKITNSKKAYFIPHPHYSLSNDKHLFATAKIKIVVSGKYDIYTYSAINEMFEYFSVNSQCLQEFSFTFIGKNWTGFIKRWNSVLDIKHIDWVDNYIEEISSYDIQLFPMSVGCGTKGKVLDALSSGLLCIGTRFAFENIAVRDKESCILYESPNDVVFVLKDLLIRKEKYKQIAKRGKLMVREYHNPDYVGKVIYELCFNNRYIVQEAIYNNF